MQRRKKNQRTSRVHCSFSANASKSKQATSRKKQLEKLRLTILNHLRKYPYVKFEMHRDLETIY